MTYQREGDRPRVPIEALLFLFCLGVLIIAGAYVGTVVETRNMEYKTGYTDAINNESDLYEQFKGIHGSESISNYMCGYETGVITKQHSEEAAIENKKREQAEKTLKNRLIKNE